MHSKKIKKIYYLETCSTCKRIIKEINPNSEVEMQDIKSSPITGSQLKGMADLAGSYENLFSRRAMKYKSLGLSEKNLTEADYKNYILEEYTFLKRPVIIVDNEIFVGNASKTIEKAKEAINNK